MAKNNFWSNPITITARLQHPQGNHMIISTAAKDQRNLTEQSVTKHKELDYF